MSITKESMEKLDKRAIEDFGIDSLILMENAGMAIYNHVKRFNSYTVVCGGGNNGGDGLAVARHLVLNNKDVDIFIINEVRTPESKKNLEILERMTRDIYYIREKEDLDQLIKSLDEKEVVIDAIFGIGLGRDVEGIYKDTIDTINRYGHLIVSVDIPSGMDADTGKILGTSVLADETVAIHEEKLCLKNTRVCGRITKVYIGIPEPYQELIVKK